MSAPTVAKKIHRLMLAAVRAEAEPRGAEVSIDTTGRHPKIELRRADGRMARIAVSCTPKDKDTAVLRAARDARRILIGG